MAKQQHDRRDEPIVISAEQARQGEIVLRKGWQRWVFVGGLVGVLVVALIVGFR